MGYPCPYVALPPASRTGQTYVNPVFTGIVDATAANTQIKFAGTQALPGLTNTAGTSGFYWNSNTLLFTPSAGVPMFSLGSGFAGLASTGMLYWSTTTSAGGSVGTQLSQVSSGVLGVGTATAIDGTVQAAVHAQMGANGQQAAWKSLSELTTIAAAATTDTAILMPAGAIVMAVSVRVVTIIPTAATFTVGDSGSAARFSTIAIPVAATTTDKGTKAGAYYNASALAVRITPNLTPGAATGQVRVTIHYLDVVPPTS